MTDKIQKIREEIERLYNQSLADENRQADRGLEHAASVSYGKSKVCKELLSFINSLPEEPLSKDLEDKEETMVYQGEVYTRVYKDKLDEFACKYPKSVPPTSKRYAKYSDVDLTIAFKAGAQWQKNKMMEDATEVTVHTDAGDYPYIPQIELYDYDKDIPLAKEGDKYKVVLIKED